MEIDFIIIKKTCLVHGHLSLRGKGTIIKHYPWKHFVENGGLIDKGYLSENKNTVPNTIHCYLGLAMFMCVFHLRG